MTVGVMYRVGELADHPVDTVFPGAISIDVFVIHSYTMYPLLKLVE